MEYVDNRKVDETGEIRIPDPEPIKVFGTVAGFHPGQNRILIRRQKETEQLGGGLVRAQAYTELSARGEVIAVGPAAPVGSPMFMFLPPVGVIATFSKYAETKEFDDQGDDTYAMPYAHDIHGWHDASH